MTHCYGWPAWTRPGFLFWLWLLAAWDGLAFGRPGPPSGNGQSAGNSSSPNAVATDA